MDGMFRKHAGRMAGLAGALLFLASLLTFHPQDPTLTNLRYPKDGIGNWAGYPGALIGGSAVEGLGIAALLLPLLLANAALFSRGRPAWRRYVFHAAALTLTAAAAIGMAGAPLVLELRGPGLLGWAAGQWMRDTLGLWPGAAALAFAGLYSLAQVAYSPALRRGFKDARVLLRFGLARLGERALAAWRQARPQTGWAWHELLLLPVHGALFAAGWLWEHAVRRAVLRPLHAAVLAWRERRYSVARVKAAAPAPAVPLSAPASPGVARFRAQAQPPASSALEDWLGEPEPETASGAAPSAASPAPALAPAAPAPAPPAPESTAAPPGPPPFPVPAPEPAARPERIARWEEYLRRYKENLDLDWDERAWKRRRLEELAQEPGEADARPHPGTPK